MNDQRPQRIYHKLTPEERARWEAARDEALALRPLLIEKGKRLRQAAQERTLTGALRSAIHQHLKPLPVIATEAGIPIEQLDEFLTGERNLRSDSMDQLARVLGFQFPPEPPPAGPKMVVPELSSPPILDPSSFVAMPAPKP